MDWETIELNDVNFDNVDFSRLFELCEILTQSMYVKDKFSGDRFSEDYFKIILLQLKMELDKMKF